MNLVRPFSSYVCKLKPCCIVTVVDVYPFSPSLGFEPTDLINIVRPRSSWTWTDEPFCIALLIGIFVPH